MSTELNQQIGTKIIEIIQIMLELSDQEVANTAFIP